jgi:hypothetical protein
VKRWRRRPATTVVTLGESLLADTLNLAHHSLFQFPSFDKHHLCTTSRRCITLSKIVVNCVTVSALGCFDIDTISTNSKTIFGTEQLIRTPCFQVYGSRSTLLTGFLTIQSPH